MINMIAFTTVLRFLVLSLFLNGIKIILTHCTLYDYDLFTEAEEECLKLRMISERFTIDFGPEEAYCASSFIYPPLVCSKDSSPFDSW